MANQKILIADDESRLRKLVRDYLTRYLPADIGILKVSDAGERFHSRLNAAEKTYCYRIAVPGVPHVFDRKYLWHFPEPLDMKKMEQAADFLTGRHDFKGFSSIKRTKKSTVRELYAIDIEKKEKEILIPPLSSVWLEKEDLPKIQVFEEYVSYQAWEGEECVSEGTVIFSYPKYFRYEDPKLSFTVEKDQITVKAEAYAKSVEILNDQGRKEPDRYKKGRSWNTYLYLVNGNS